MLLAPADVGYESKACLTPLGWCLSTRPLSARTWCGSEVVGHAGERLVASGADDVYERIVLPGGGAPNARMPISGLPWQPDPYRISWDRRRATA